jgi:hypothetical protein
VSLEALTTLATKAALFHTTNQNSKLHSCHFYILMADDPAVIIFF